MNKRKLARILILMCLSVVPIKMGYTANLSVPAWAYESVQYLANDGIVTLPSGVTDVGQANLNRKDMALLVVKAINNLNDKGMGRTDYQQITDSSIVTKKAIGNISATKQLKREEGYKITAGEFQNGKYDSDLVKIDALKVEFDKELRDLGMGASYIANSLATSSEADADKRAEDAKYSFAGEARFSYSGNSGSDTNLYRQSRLRVRLYGKDRINSDWSILGMVEADKYFLNNDHGETDWFNFDRYYLQGKTGVTSLNIGRFGYNIAEGNIYDTSFNGISASLGDAVKYTFIAGQTDGEAEAYGLTAKYTDYDYDIETGFHQFGYDKWNSSSRTIAHAGVNYYFDNFRLGAIYLHSDLADAEGNKEGYVGTLAYGKLKTWVKGTYEFQAKYYRQPVGTYITHTMSGLGGRSDGFKGLGLFFYYTLDTNIVAGIEYYHLRDLLSDEKGNTLWGQVSYYF